ncbi:MAG: hypothetical protein HY783_03475 [Chloroflexi bacterium]|nr:hypothetical protein [Chloroflexota bacterium]
MPRSSRTIKHLSLHRIGETELRVVADVEEGVIPLIQAEEAVIRGYAQRGFWPHRYVTLFILQDLQPLVRQLRPGADLPPGGALALNHRPVVNVYDLADPTSCHVFVNRQAITKEGYWDDPLAIQGLLAHEHAHPLAENETTRSSRRSQVELSLEGPPSTFEIRNSKFEIRSLLTLLADKLCVYAPREIFANEVAIRSGFGSALLHLDRRNVTNAGRSVAGREELRRQLQQEVTQGSLTPEAADMLLLIGDLRGYLDLALEIAPFYRTGRESDAQELEAILEAYVFPHLEPEVPRAYAALREQYIVLDANMTPTKLMVWGEWVLNTLAKAVAEKGLTLQYVTSST